MNEPLFYLETNSFNPFYNLSFEEVVLSTRLSGNYLILWQNDRTIVIGRNQNAAAEINRDFVDRHGIYTVRRCSGGGAVYHDLGNLNYSFITDSTTSYRNVIQQFMNLIADTLQQLNLDAVVSGRNDILVEGHKVSGTAQRILGNRILHHGTLLFDSDLDMVASSLNVDPRKYESKGIKSVRGRVGNIRSFLSQDMDILGFQNHIKNTLGKSGLIPSCLTQHELSAVSELCANKYQTWDWNYGKSPNYAFSDRRKWPGGILEVQLSVEAGVIANIAFLGDFLSVLPLDIIEGALKGCRMCWPEVESTLNKFDLSLYFGEIAENEILQTIFDAYG